MRILVCGGRDYADVARVDHVLSVIHKRRNISLIIEGGARGADKIAREWAAKNHVACETFVADWRSFGKRAGPVRNQRMIENGQPDGVVAFPGGIGTSDMVGRAKAAKIKVFEVNQSEEL